MAPHACVVPSRAYYKKASKAARAALKVERWKAGAWPGAVRAREVAAARLPRRVPRARTVARRVRQIKCWTW